MIFGPILETNLDKSLGRKAAFSKLGQPSPKTSTGMRDSIPPPSRLHIFAPPHLHPALLSMNRLSSCFFGRSLAQRQLASDLNADARHLSSRPAADHSHLTLLPRPCSSCSHISHLSSPEVINKPDVPHTLNRRLKNSTSFIESGTDSGEAREM